LTLTGLFVGLLRVAFFSSQAIRELTPLSAEDDAVLLLQPVINRSSGSLGVLTDEPDVTWFWTSR